MTLNNLNVLIATAFITLSSCDVDDPKKEDTPELITKVTLTFTPVGGGDAVVSTATDNDLQGPNDLTIDGPIELEIGKTYTLAILLINELYESSKPEYNITKEVEEEGDEHQIFFSWTNNIFSNPTGSGNIGTQNGMVNYTGADNSLDSNGLPLGLTTTWTSASAAATGSFRVLLKHQPELKSIVSNSSAGETDIDITFTVDVE